MPDNIEKHSTSQKKFINLLKLSNEKNKSLPDNRKEFVVQLNDKTSIEFSQDDWESLNKIFSLEEEVSNNIDTELSAKQEYNDSPREIMEFSIKITRQGLINNPEGTITFLSSKDIEENGISFYYCTKFEINGLQPLIKTRKALLKISQELKNAKYYLEEAYKGFDKFAEESNSTEELSPQKLEERNNTFLKVWAFREVGVLILARIYDVDKNAVSFPNTLKSIQKSFHDWSKIPENNLQENALDMLQIEQDLKKLSKDSEVAVKKLFNQRDKSIAHLDETYAFRFSRSSKVLPAAFPDRSELDKLIIFVNELLERYSRVINLSLNEY